MRVPVCAIHQNNGGSLFLAQANLCLHHIAHLYHTHAHTHTWYILYRLTALECGQQVSFGRETAVYVIEGPGGGLCVIPSFSWV